jgi:hypothetical protein
MLVVTGQEVEKNSVTYSEIVMDYTSQHQDLSGY